MISSYQHATAVAVVFEYLAESDSAAPPDPDRTAEAYIGICPGEMTNGLLAKRFLDLSAVQDGSDYIVHDRVFNVYGRADSRLEAFKDYLVSLREYFGILESNASMDEYDLAAFERLSEYFEKIA